VWIFCTFSFSNTLFRRSTIALQVVIGGSCSAASAAAQQILALNSIPLVTYASLDAAVPASTGTAYFLRASLAESPSAAATALLDLFAQLQLVQFGLFSADGEFGALDDAVLALAAQRAMDVRVCGDLAALSPTSNAANVARIAAAIDDFMLHAIKVICIYAPLELARMIGAALFARGVYGANFVVVVAQQLLTPELSADEASFSVFGGAIALQAVPSAAASAPTAAETAFITRYTAAGYSLASGGDSPGFFGRFAYDAITVAVRALNALRDACVVNITQARLQTAMQAVAAFDGASGPLVFNALGGAASDTWNRAVDDGSGVSYRVMNLGAATQAWTQVCFGISWREGEERLRGLRVSCLF
jgi:ABC-type branched-subunit amino acid transport system substrate-binding protein